LKVTGITGGKEPVAIINEQSVKKGDEIDGLKIIEITEDYVKFQCGDKIITKGIGGVVSKEELEKLQ